jgi:hypothetical protein
MMVAIPMLVVYCTAAPVSTVETPPEEPQEDSETARSQLPWTAPFRLSNNVAGAAPPDDMMTPGLKNPRATQIGLVQAVQNVQSRKFNERLNFVSAVQLLSQELRKPGELRTLTPNQVMVERMRDIAKELQGELEPQAEEENLLKANETPIEETEEDGDGGKKRITFFPRL